MNKSVLFYIGFAFFVGNGFLANATEPVAKVKANQGSDKVAPAAPANHVNNPRLGMTSTIADDCPRFSRIAFSKLAQGGVHKLQLLDVSDCGRQLVSGYKYKMKVRAKDAAEVQQDCTVEMCIQLWMPNANTAKVTCDKVPTQTITVTDTEMSTF